MCNLGGVALEKKTLNSEGGNDKFWMLFCRLSQRQAGRSGRVLWQRCVAKMPKIFGAKCQKEKFELRGLGTPTPGRSKPKWSTHPSPSDHTGGDTPLLYPVHPPHIKP